MEDSDTVHGTPKFSVTIADAAWAIALSENYLRLLAARGMLPYVRVGRAIRFMVSDLEQFLLDHRTDSRTADRTTTPASASEPV